MVQYDNLYCKLFIDTDTTREELISMLEEFTNGTRKLFQTVITEFCEIDINDNMDYYSEQKQNDDFLYYKFFLDIEPNMNASELQYINSISELMGKFSLQKITAVPACDFENDLNLN